ncbi:TonB-dependent receptor plug domain-containing protein [Mixta intestinalis]|uniref:Colicin I receptor n=1 Tax=Mixta intestinalis TaxID=1615494 RepID=A0A6P1Q0C7_9GAMM|nr:TonB-dependent receptor [Mixta intestinalis]QHM72390.1 Colicin I receptor [Mixta intestinalis]
MIRLTRNRRFLLSALTLSFAQHAAAEITSQEKTLVVTSSRSATSLWNSPATIQVIDKETLEKSTNVSLADELRDVPGVEITDNALAGRKQVRIRGEASSRVLMLIDGQEVTYQRAGQDYGPGLLIDESALERIEIVKGPYSVLYGSQAIGGVVNFITRKGGDKPLGGVIKATYDTSTNGWSESAAAWGSIGHFDYRLNGSYADHNERDTPDGRLPDTGYRNHSQGAWLGYRWDKHKFGLSLDRYNLSTQTWYDSPDYEEFSVRIPKLEREKLGLFYDYEADGKYLKSLHVDAYVQTLERQFENNIAVVQSSGSPMIGNISVANQTQSLDKQNTRGLTLQSDFDLPGNNHLVMGSQYQQDRIRQRSAGYTHASTSTGFPPGANYIANKHSHNRGEQASWSLFAQNEWRFADNWNWTVGARQYWLESSLLGGDETVDHSSKGVSVNRLKQRTAHDNALVASTSLRYSGFENTELRLAFAQGYVFPTLSQQFMQTSAGNGISYGNPDLKAEHSNNYEFGVRYNGNMWLIDGAVYYSEADDYIASVACAGQAVCEGNNNSGRGDGYYFYDNISRAKTYGMELSAEYNGWEVSPYISGNLLRRQYIGQNHHTWHTGEPTLSGRIGLKHTLLLNAMTLSSDLWLRASAKAEDDTSADAPGKRYPGWATLNLAFSSEFGPEEQYRVNLALNNLTNKRYKTAHESIPVAGFNAAMGFAWTF